MDVVSVKRLLNDNCVVLQAAFLDVGHNSVFCVLTSTCVRRYSRLNHGWKLVQTKPNVQRRITGLVCINGAIFEIGENLKDIRDVLGKFPWFIHENILYYVNAKSQSEIVYQIPQDNYVYHMETHQGVLHVYSMDLFGPPVLNIRTFQLNKNDRTLLVTSLFDVPLQKPLSCITAMDNWIVTGSDCLTLFSKKDPSHMITALQKGPPITAIAVFKSEIAYTRADRTVYLAHFDGCKIVVRCKTLAPSLFTSILFTSSKSLAAYNTHHYPVSWTLKNGKLYNMEIDGKEAHESLTGVSALSQRLQVRTDGNISRTTATTHYELLNMADTLGKCIRITPSQRGRYVVWNDQGALCDFSFPDEILDYGENYIVTKDRVYLYSASSEGIKLHQSFEYELYEFNLDVLIIYNQGNLICVCKGHVLQQYPLEFVSESLLTLCVSWNGNDDAYVSIGNMLKMHNLKFHFDVNRFTYLSSTTFLSTADDIGILCGIPAQGIYVGENHMIYLNGKPYPYHLPFRFVELFQFGEFTFVGLTTSNELIAVTNGVHFSLSKHLNIGNAVRVSMECWPNKAYECMTIVTEDKVSSNIYQYIYSSKGRNVNSEPIDDVITKVKDNSMTSLLIGTNALHTHNTLSNRLSSVALDAMIVQSAIFTLNASADMLCLVVFHNDEYTLKWFSNKLETLKEIDSPQMKSHLLISLDERNKQVFCEGTTWSIVLGEAGLVEHRKICLGEKTKKHESLLLLDTSYPDEPKRPFPVSIWTRNDLGVIIDNQLCVWKIDE